MVLRQCTALLVISDKNKGAERQTTKTWPIVRKGGVGGGVDQKKKKQLAFFFPEIKAKPLKMLQGKRRYFTKSRRL